MPAIRANSSNLALLLETQDPGGDMTGQKALLSPATLMQGKGKLGVGVQSWRKTEFSELRCPTSRDSRESRQGQATGEGGKVTPETQSQPCPLTPGP